MTVSSTLLGVFLKGTAGARPAANAVAGGTVYSATDTGVISQSDGSSWSTWATISSGLADPMTTRGDIIVRNSSNVTSRLGRGAAGTVLTSDGTDVAWAAGGIAVTSCKAYHSTTQSVGAGATITLAFDSEEFDDAGTPYHDLVTNNSRMTAPVTGRYLVGASAFTASSGNELELWFRKGGSSDIRSGNLVVGGTDGTQAHYVTPVALTAAEFLEVRLFSKNSTSVSGGAAPTAAEFWIARLS